MVTGPNGPEAGVWVIAETTDLPTRFIKSVVTDDQGRYLIPELPKASYEVFARGYGLVDSAEARKRARQDRQHHRGGRADAEGRRRVLSGDLLVRDAEDAGEARVSARQRQDPGRVAQRHQDQRLLRLPRARQQGDAHHPADVLRHEAGGCLGAAHPVRPGHDQHGDRDRPHRRRSARSSCSPTGPTASPRANCPPRSRTRPQGSERNVVITQWDFSDPKHYLHDITSTDKRKPTVNANGQIYGAVENSTDMIPVLDPVKHMATSFTMPVRDPKTHDLQERSDVAVALLGRGGDLGRPDHHAQSDVSTRRAASGSPRASARRPIRTSARRARDHPSAKVFPLETSTRHLSMFDPTTGKITLIRTCYPTHHLVFAEDANNTLWMSAGGPGSGVLGWLDRKVFEETGDEAEGAGLDADRPRHQRQRQARRIGRAEPAARSGQGQARRRRALRHRRQSARTARSGASVLTYPGLRDPRRSGRRIRRRPRSPKSTSRRCRATVRAASTSTATASPGCRSSSGHMGKLRPQQVQGAERARDRDRPALPGGLDALSVPRPAVAGIERDRQRGGELLHLGRSVRHVRARPRTCRGRPATPTSR